MSQLTDTFQDLQGVGISPDRVAYLELGPEGLKISFRDPVPAVPAVEAPEPTDRSADDAADWYAASEGYNVK